MGRLQHQPSFKSLQSLQAMLLDASNLSWDRANCKSSKIIYACKLALFKLLLWHNDVHNLFLTACCIKCLLCIQVTAGWASPPNSPSGAQKTISLTLLGNQPLVRTVQDIGRMPFTEFAALYAVSCIAASTANLGLQFRPAIHTSADNVIDMKTAAATFA